MKSEKKYVNMLDRALKIEDWAEKHFIDPNCVVYSLLDKQTEGPITDSFYRAEDNPFTVPGFSPAEFANYENCGMTTGAYLQGQLYHYAVDKDPQNLKNAQRCFNGLKYIYNMGKQLDEGFFPKIYGNRFTAQTSTDQVLYAVMGMDHYYQYADKAEKADIDRMITAMIRFWVKRDYRYKYYTIENMQWPLGRFPSLLLLAFRHSGDPVFKDEYNRLLAMGLNEFPVEEQLRPKLNNMVQPMPYERKMHAWLISHMADAVTMETMELDFLMANDKNNPVAANWKRSIDQMWHEAILTLSPDGKMYQHTLVDMDTKEVRRPEPEIFTEEIGLLDWPGFRHISGAKTGWSTMVARAGVQAYRHLKDDSMLPVIANILSGVDLDGLTYCDDPERLLPQIRHQTRYYSGDAMANWLWAYWQGRYDGIITA